MLGFIAAMHRSPAALVFTTTGCDPAGMQSALHAVHSSLHETAAVYLTCFIGLNIIEPPYTTVLEVQRSEPTAAVSADDPVITDCVVD